MKKIEERNSLIQRKLRNWSIKKVNSSYRVNAIYKQKFNVKTLIFAYF